MLSFCVPNAYHGVRNRSTRKWEVVFVAPGHPDRWIRVPAVGGPKDEPVDPKNLPEGDPDVEIEGLIIPAVKDLHTEYLDDFEQRQV